MFLAGIAFTACSDDDYTDWAEPQSNAPEAAAGKYEISFATGKDAAIVMDAFYANVAEEDQATDSVEIAQLSAGNAAIASLVLNSVNVNGVTIPAAWKEGNIVKVNTLELDSIVRDAFKSRAHVERTLDVNINASAKLTSGEAVNVQGVAHPTLTPISTPALCEKGYMLLGDLEWKGNGGWNAETPIVMNPVEGQEGIFRATVKTSNEGSNWFKLYEAYDPAGGWDAANKGEMGCRKNGDDSTENFLVWKGDVYSLQCPTITGAGYFQITLDAINFTYSVAPASAILYMAGDVNGWNQVDMLVSPSYDNIYKGYMYLNQNGFKFCTEPNWNGTNYGEDFSTDGGAGNIVMTEEEGFYQVIVDLNEKKMTLTAITTIGLIGSATAGGWDADTPMTYDKEGRCWSVTTDLVEGEFKFRANEDWDMANWGGDSFDNLSEGGNNLKITAAGKYTIKLYPLCQGKAYCTVEAAE